MNDILSPNQSRLETLPNELFVEIFEYFDVINLRSFKSLNKRIDSIIGTLKVNLVIEYQDDDDLDYLSTFHPTHIIRLEMFDFWPSFSLTTVTELRSLAFDCTYLSKQQLDEIVGIYLPFLERLSVVNVPYDLREALFATIFLGEHFPSLKKCRLKLRHSDNLEFQDTGLPSNNIVRSLAVDKWEWSELNFLLHQLPHLRRLETNLEDSSILLTDTIQPHLSLNHLRITLGDPVYHLEQILKRMPNITRLRIRGNLGRSNAFAHFEKMARYLPARAPHLQRFDCELYCYSHTYGRSELAIQELHPLFKRIRCVFGRDANLCYSTDLEVYLHDNEYERVCFDDYLPSSHMANDFRLVIQEPITYTASYKRNYYYDDDDYFPKYNDDDNGFVDYGLGYRENYKRNYGSSPWSGNND